MILINHSTFYIHSKGGGINTDYAVGGNLEFFRVFFFILLSQASGLIQVLLKLVYSEFLLLR